MFPLRVDIILLSINESAERNMKVSELIEQLQKMPQDKEVIVSGEFNFAKGAIETTFPDEDEQGTPYDHPIVLIFTEDTEE